MAIWTLLNPARGCSTDARPAAKVSAAVLPAVRLESVTSRSIRVSWTGLSQQTKYKVKLVSDSSSLQTETSDTTASFSDLTPGTKYTVIITYLSCNIRKSISRDIITAANIYEISTRILSIEYMSGYANHSSKLYRDFSANFTKKVENNLPKSYQDFVKAKEMVVVVRDIRRGSVIVDFDLVTATEINLTTADVQNSIINALKASKLNVDFNNTHVKEANICLRGEHICSQNGSCIRDGPSYTCECKKGFQDKNPALPGTDCKIKNKMSKIGISSVLPNPNGDWRVAAIVLGVLLGVFLLILIIIGIVTVSRRNAANEVASYCRYFPHFLRNNQEAGEDVQGSFSYRDV